MGGTIFMTMIMAAASREGKKLNDTLFEAGAAAQAAIKTYGADRVINGTVGCYAGDDEQIACLPVVEDIYRQLPMRDFIAYAPPIGLPDYRKAVIEETFEDQQPDGYTGAVATAGGTGAIHIAVANYSEAGDAVLVSDWRWGNYDSLCREIGRRVQPFALFDSERDFNIESFSSAVSSLLRSQDSLLIILNSPANNPTGFALSYQEWDQVLQVCRFHEREGKRISLLIDIAYIAYAGEKNEVRTFMKQFSNLPEHIFTMFAFSMSKGYTLYGQRAGALVGLSSSQAVIDEFDELGRYSARTTWSNVNRAAMTLLTTIRSDASLMKRIDAERKAFYEVLCRRAAIFTTEAEACQLHIVPYHAGFFVSIPTAAPKKVSQALNEDLVFAAPIALGIRLGVCSIPEQKMLGLAAKVKKAITACP
jgi:aromatic-amino-acid transaminase